MFQKTGAKFKVEEFVIITLTGQKPFEAIVFLSIGDRLIDLLNDARLFIPVKRMDNSTVIMAKSNIVSIVEKDRFEAAEEDPIASQDITPQYEYEDYEGDGAEGEADAEDKEKAKKRRRRRRKKPTAFDAYAVLKVSPDASIEEIRKAYKSRIKAVHPDSVAALDLDDDLIRAALHSTQKVNYAYHHILKQRRNEENPPKKEGAKSANNSAEEAATKETAKEETAREETARRNANPSEGEAA